MVELKVDVVKEDGAKMDKDLVNKDKDIDNVDKFDIPKMEVT